MFLEWACEVKDLTLWITRKVSGLWFNDIQLEQCLIKSPIKKQFIQSSGDCKQKVCLVLYISQSGNGGNDSECPLDNENYIVKEVQCITTDMVPKSPTGDPGHNSSDR